MITVNYSRVFQLSTLCLVMAISACSTTGKPVLSDHAEPVKSHDHANASTPTLYDRLGGQPGVRKLADQFLIELAADDRVRKRFAKSDIGRFHSMMQEHTCEIADGPCEYSGDNMVRAHGGMNIRSSEFNAVVEALMRAMDSIQLPISTQNRLLARLAVFRPEVVGQ